MAAALTYPVCMHLWSSGWLGVARPYGRPDVYNHIWNVWFFSPAREGVLGEGGFLHTPLLFYPVGFDLSFHTINLVHVALVLVLARGLDWVGGFNLAGLVLLVAAALAARQAALALCGSRRAAWFAGAAFAFNPWMLFHVTLHPDLMTLFPLPLAVYGCLRAERSSRPIGWAVGSGLCLSLAAYCGLYLFVIGVITVALFVAWLATRSGRWRAGGFWTCVVVAAGVATAASAPRLVPMFSSVGGLGGVLEQKFDSGSSVDMLRLLIPFGNPLLGSRNMESNLGGPDVSTLVSAIPFGLALLGVWAGERRAAARFWVALLLFFLVMTLGSTLMVGGVRFDFVPMAREKLSEWLPVPFAAFRESKLFFAGALLPLALAASIGLARVLERIENKRRRRLLLAGLLVATLGESWIGAFRPVDLSVSQFYRDLRAEPGGFALIELPFGRRAAKRYAYFQTVHEHPIQEGAVSRAPEGATEFLHKNRLTDAWWRASNGDFGALECANLGKTMIAAEASRLIDIGFRYVIVHAGAPPPLRQSFGGLEPVYADAELAAYSLEAIERQPFCLAGRQGSASQPEQLRDTRAPNGTLLN